MPGAKFGLLNIGRRYGRCHMRFLLVKKLIPAAPNAGTAVLVTRFFFEACFTRGMVASSNRCKKDLRESDPTLTK